MSKDKINPSHYKDNPIQTFDAITSQFTDAEKIGAIKFNICKYIMRMGKKVETLEGARDDAGKAHWYCERLLKELTDMIKKKKPKKKQRGGSMDARSAFLKARARKPSGRLTVDEIKRAKGTVKSIARGLAKAAVGPVAAISKAGKKAGRLAKRGYGIARR